VVPRRAIFPVRRLFLHFFSCVLGAALDLGTRVPARRLQKQKHHKEAPPQKNRHKARCQFPLCFFVLSRFRAALREGEFKNTTALFCKNPMSARSRFTRQLTKKHVGHFVAFLGVSR
jgi:hypothetical protein